MYDTLEKKAGKRGHLLERLVVTVPVFTLLDAFLHTVLGW
jgi:hypothetical protein